MILDHVIFKSRRRGFFHKFQDILSVFPLFPSFRFDERFSKLTRFFSINFKISFDPILDPIIFKSFTHPFFVINQQKHLFFTFQYLFFFPKDTFPSFFRQIHTFFTRISPFYTSAATNPISRSPADMTFLKSMFYTRSFPVNQQKHPLFHFLVTSFLIRLHFSRFFTKFTPFLPVSLGQFFQNPKLMRDF